MMRARRDRARAISSRSPVSGAKAQAFIERAWTSGPTKEVALFIGSPFHGCGVAAGGLDTAIVGLIRGYACRRAPTSYVLLILSFGRVRLSKCAKSFTLALYRAGVFPNRYCFENAKQSCN